MPPLMLLLTVMGLIVPAAGQSGPGDLNPGFDPGEVLASGAPATIHAMVTESDGDVIVVGDFTSLGGVARGRIARVKADGTLDPTFATGTGADGPIHCVAVQSSGRLLIGGDFTSYNGTERSRIARLTPSGALDPIFNPGTGADGAVRAIAGFDGDVWIGGDFTSVNGQARQHLASMNSYGFLQGRSHNCDGPVLAMAVREGYDSTLFIGGDFSTAGGQPRPYLAQIDRYGFAVGPLTEGSGPNGPVFALALEQDSRSWFDDPGLLVGGSFTMVDGKLRGGLARIAIDYAARGSLDPFFSVAEVPARPSHGCMGSSGARFPASRDLRRRRRLAPTRPSFPGVAPPMPPLMSSSEVRTEWTSGSLWEAAPRITWTADSFRGRRIFTVSREPTTTGRAILPQWSSRRPRRFNGRVRDHSIPQSRA